MRNDIIDTSTACFGKPCVAKGRRIGTGRNDEVMDIGIDLFRSRSHLVKKKAPENTLPENALIHLDPVFGSIKH